jgi:hypothetical protein
MMLFRRLSKSGTLRKGLEVTDHGRTTLHLIALLTHHVSGLRGGSPRDGPRQVWGAFGTSTNSQ